MQNSEIGFLKFYDITENAQVNLHTDLRFYNNSLKNSELEVIINYILEERVMF